MVIPTRTISQLQRHDIKLFYTYWCLLLAFLVALVKIASAQQGNPSPNEPVPPEYLQVRYAMGRGDFGRAHLLADSLFQQPNIYPPLYVTAAYLFVYEKRFAVGHVYFDSLLARGHQPGNIAGAQAILWQTQQEPDSSLKYARHAMLANCTCVYPYEIFVEKSFELKRSQAAWELLQRQYQRYPENWRLTYAMAIWHSQKGELPAACDSLRALLLRNVLHWRLYYALGYNLGNQERWQEAQNVYQEGIRFCHATQDEEGLTRMLHGAALVQRELGLLEDATRSLQQGFYFANHIGNRVIEGRLMILLGQTQLQQHQWSLARQTFETVVQRAYLYSNGQLLLQAHDFLAEYALEIGKRSEALVHTQKAFEIADSLGIKSQAAANLIDLFLIEFEAGRKTQALELIQKALAYVRSEKLDSYLSFVYQNLATVLNALGRYSEALDYCIKAQALAKNNSNFEQMQRLEFLRGEISLHLGQLQQAHTLLLRAAIASKNARLMTPFMSAQILLCQMEISKQQYSQAKRDLTDALSALPELPAYETNLKTLGMFADIAWLSGERPQAIKILEDALRIVVAQTHRFGPEQLSSLSGGERDIFFRLSRCYFETGQIEQALAETERARDLIVKRKRWQAQQLREAKLDSANSRRLAMLDSLLQRARLQRATTDSQALQFSLKAKIDGWESELARLQTEALGQGAGPWLQTAAFPLQDFRRSLHARQELALSFFVGDSATLIFFIATDTLSAACVAVGEPGWEQRLSHIHQSLNTVSPLNPTQSTARFDTSAAQEAYRLLAQNFLAARPETALAIVPDGVLCTLPFELLPLARETTGAAPFLIERFAIRYGSTLADLEQNGGEILNVNSFLLAADPVLQPDGPPHFSASRNGGLPLPETGRREAEAIRHLVRCQTDLTRSKLTREALLAALRQSQWLHLASHCLAQPSEPLHSEVILSIPPGLETPEVLFAFEVFPLTLPLQMAILSGCETVRGTFVESEGFEGLLQAFRAAGTPSVIASLWKVNDYASAEFFRGYYTALCEGAATVRALQIAKIKMLKHGNYNFTDWAAFLYYGRDWRVVMPRPWAFREWALLVGIAVLIILIAGGRLWQLKKKSEGVAG